MPKDITKFLQLPDIEKYTGHSFRITSATMLANAGDTSIMLQNHGGRKSAKVAQEYVADSINNKRKICDKIIKDLVDKSSCDTAASAAGKNLKLDELVSMAYQIIQTRVKMENSANILIMY